MTETTTPQTPTTEKHLPVQVFQEMELMDENQILREMKGELLEEFVYDIEIQGRRVTNLSYQGVKEAIRRRGKYEILDVHVEEDKDQFRCLVKVRDLIRQIDVLGASTCEKMKPFSYTLAINKSERNAYRKLIPEKLIAGMVREFLDRKQQPKPVTAQVVHAKEAETSKPTVISAGTPQGTKSPSDSPVPANQSPFQEKLPQPTENSTSKDDSAKAAPQSLASISDELLASELAKLPWRENSKGNGWNVRWDPLPQLIKAKLATKFAELQGTQYLKLEGYSYRRFGAENEMLARYTIKPKPSASTATSEDRTKTLPEVPETQSPAEKQVWKVPVTKNQVTPEWIEKGVRQYPLLRGLQSYGMINQLEDELAIVPERLVNPESPPVKWFIHGTQYKPGVIVPLCEKHGLKWELELDEKGSLKAIVLHGKQLEKKQVEELLQGATWAFKATMEEKKP